MAIRYGKTLGDLAAHQSDEVILLTTFGLVLVVVAAHPHVSAASMRR